MKTKHNTPTSSKSARHNGRAGNDTNRPKVADTPNDELHFCVLMPAGAFERMSAAVRQKFRKA